MIGIILCTYNGDRFLKEQMESLFAQSCHDFVIYVHDDGSTDRTMNIIEGFKAEHPEKIVLMDDPIMHRGVGPSFMWVLQNIESEYYMFCDQDDFWLPFKVEHTINRIKEVEKQYPNMPVLIHTDLILTDSDLNETHHSFWDYQNFKVDISKYPQFIAFGNVVTGCTMVINQAAKQLATHYEGHMLHDYWLALAVAKYGVIENLKQQTILYRQHNKNEAGAGNQYNRLSLDYKNFAKGINEEYSRFCNVCSKGFLAWFYYRFVYFIHRHFF